MRHVKVFISSLISGYEPYRAAVAEAVETLGHQLNGRGHGRGQGGGARLAVAVAGGPHQQVLRPVELEQADLPRDIQREALFGEHPVLDPGEGTSTTIQGGALMLGQANASLIIDQAGSMCVVQAARRDTDPFRTALPALLEEDLAASLARAVRFSAGYWIASTPCTG